MSDVKLVAYSDRLRTAIDRVMGAQVTSVAGSTKRPGRSTFTDRGGASDGSAEYNGYFKIVDASETTTNEDGTTNTVFKVAVVDGAEYADGVEIEKMLMSYTVDGISSGYYYVKGWISDALTPITNTRRTVFIVALKYDTFQEERRERASFVVVKDEERPESPSLPSNTSRYSYCQIGRVAFTYNSESKTYAMSIYQDAVASEVNVIRKNWEGYFRLIDISEKSTGESGNGEMKYKVRVGYGNSPYWLDSYMLFYLDGETRAVKIQDLPELFTGDNKDKGSFTVYLRVSNINDFADFVIDYENRQLDLYKNIEFSYARIGSGSKSKDGLYISPSTRTSTFPEPIWRKNMLTYVGPFKMVCYSSFDVNKETNQAENIKRKIAIVGSYRPTDKSNYPEYNGQLEFRINSSTKNVTEWVSEEITETTKFALKVTMAVDENGDPTGSMEKAEFVTLKPKETPYNTVKEFWYTIGTVTIGADYYGVTSSITQTHVTGEPHLTWYAPCGMVEDDKEGWSK